MTQEFGRKLSVVVADAVGQGLEFAQFRCVFNIQRGDSQNPNSCDMRIYGLKQDTANRIQGKEFSTITVSAGYDGNFGLIFTGTIKQRRKGRVDQKDTYVDITAADGDEAYNYSKMALSLAADSRPVSGLLGIIQSIASAQAPADNQMPDLPNNGRARGRVFYGMSRDELRDFCNSYGLTWSIQDNLLTFVPKGGYIPGNIPIISPETGLIGVPEQTENGIEMRVLLNPLIKIGQLVKLDSTINPLRFGLDVQSQDRNLSLQQLVDTNADGLYYVMVANHAGDSRGNYWYTDLICLSVDANFTGNDVQPPLPSDAIIGTN